MSAEGMSHKVRRIAILVTSLDASAGRQLLMAMPSELARQVRRAMSQLTKVDPEEQRQILAEFRMQALISSDSGSVASRHTRPEQPSASAPAAAVYSASSGENLSSKPGQSFQDMNAAASSGSRPWNQATGPAGEGDDPYARGPRESARPWQQPWQQLNLDSLGELLRGERATVVAVVLSQLEPGQAANLLGRLPKPLQREAIVSLSRLGQIDPDAMAAIDEHLASRISDYHHRQAGENETTGRMQELLAAASPDLREDWQATLIQAEPLVASRMGLALPADPSSAPTVSSTAPSTASTRSTAARSVSGQASRDLASVAGTNSASPSRPSSAGATPSGRSSNMLELFSNNVVTTADPRVSNNPSATRAPANDSRTDQPSADLAEETAGDDEAHILPFPTPGAASRRRSIRFDEILDLPTEVIGAVLAAADTEVILYALAGASPAFMKRFTSMLERADSRALQARLRSLGAINLRDVDAAQQHLCELALEKSQVRAAA